MKLYPEQAVVPQMCVASDFVICPLQAKHNELDYEALNQSAPYYRAFSPSDWSTEEHTLAENFAELDEHYEQHLARKAFTFTILNPSQSECLGCIYVNRYHGLLKWLRRPEAELAKVKDFEAQVYFWTRPSCFDSDLDRRILTGMLDWLHEEWSFSRMVVQTYAADARQIKILRESDLREIASHPLPKGDGRLVLFSRP